MKKKFVKLNILLSVIWAAFACGCGSDVDYVKNGTLNGFEQTTVGKAFDDALVDAKWESFETEKGVRVVQVSGWFSRTEDVTFEDLYNTCFRTDEYKVIIQFQILANSDAFKLSYCKIGRSLENCNGLLNFIYNKRFQNDLLAKNCSFLQNSIAKEDFFGEKNGQTIYFKQFNDVWKKYWGSYKPEEAASVCPEGLHLPTYEELQSLMERGRSWAELLKIAHGNGVYYYLFGKEDYCTTGSINYGLNCHVLCHAGKVESNNNDDGCRDEEGNWICE